MELFENSEAFYDFTRPSGYELQNYLINDGKKHPFAVICPGGAYAAVCNFIEGRPFAEALNRKGYNAFVLYYRVREEARYPNPQDDLKRAVNEIMEHADEWGVDTEGWSVWGSSAGGHLAASYCLEEYDAPKPALVVLCYAVITMGEKTHPGTRDNLLGSDPDPALIDRTSVEKHVTPSYPAAYVWCGDADDLVDPDNTRMMGKALDEAGVPNRTFVFEGIPHGAALAVGTSAEHWFDDAVEFWEEQRKAGRKAD